MGTSTFHRSPETEAWKRVRELYSQPDPDPSEVTSRIVSALEPETKAGMSDAAVATCLGTVVEGVQRVEHAGLTAVLDDIAAGREPAAVQIAAGLRDRAEGLVAGERVSSRFGDLALEAVGTTALAIATLSTSGTRIMEVPLSVAEEGFAQFGRAGQLNRAAALFLGHDLDQTFRYFVARDVGDFIGGEGLPSVSHANRLEDAGAAHCRQAWNELSLGDYEDVLASAINLSPRERAEALSPVVATGVEQGLDVLGAGVG